MKFHYSFWVLILFVMISCASGGTKPSADDVALLDQASHLFAPLTSAQFVSTANPSSEEKVELGRMLFHDPNLSRKKTISCNSCHQLDNFGVDGEALSLGDEGKRGLRNSPTVINAGAQFAQFLDGRSRDLEDQAGKPILDALEHNIPNEQFLVDRLAAIPEYERRFAEAFPDEPVPVSFENVGKALGAFQRTLIARSRFDQFLDGEHDALTAQEKVGLKTFIQVGCVACHSGPLLGGTMLHRFPLLGQTSDYLKDGSDPGKARDLPESEQADAQNIWKVSPLRNITRTAPYMHNGEIADLAEVVRMMGKAQLNKEFSEDELQALLAFMQSLEGDLDADQKRVPELPATL